ncbi:MAG: putative methyltransferase [Candidatus Nomurabacteria bacterium]|nr:putative methyltransferase [Candidatus Nomurabacteria bacterium]
MFLIVFFISSLFQDAPFVPVNSSVLKKIVESLELEPGSVLYDLGCGDGRVLKEALKEVKGIQAIGIEKNILPFTLSKISLRKTSAKVILGNFLKTDISNATHIYLYLFPKIVNRLFFKFKEECRSGTRIVTCDFIPRDITPDKVIDLPLSHNGLCKKLYVFILK